MRKFITFLLVTTLMSLPSIAQTYYVSASGNDANNGTSLSSQWKTLDKVIAVGASLPNNAVISFNRGDSFSTTQTWNLPKNGMRLTAHGTGARPVITSMVPATSWTAQGANIYRASAPFARKGMRVVTINGAIQRMGRWPNYSEANRGYKNYQTVGTWTIRDTTLANSPSWVGATVVIRGNSYTANPGVITAQSNGTITYRLGRNINVAAPNFDAVKPRYGYFIQNDPRTLDQHGEWYHDTVGNNLSVFTAGNAATYQVRYAAVDTLINVGSRSNTIIENLELNGANGSAIFAKDGDSLLVNNCVISNAAKGFQSWFVGRVTISNNEFYNCLSTSIQPMARSKKNIRVLSNKIRRNAPFIGMGSSYTSADNKAIYATADSFVIIRDNYIDSSSLAGIEAGGNNVWVKNNTITNYCLELDDGGGIYMYAGLPVVGAVIEQINRVIEDNIVMYPGNPSAGTPNPNDVTGDVTGIYLDGITMNVTVRNNTIVGKVEGKSSFDNKNAIHSNNGHNVEIRGNTTYGARHGISMHRWDYYSIENMNIKRNIIHLTSPDHKAYRYVNAALNQPAVTTLANALKSVGSIDSNYISDGSAIPVYTEINLTSGSSAIATTPLTFNAWKELTGFDSNSTIVNKFVPFTIKNTVGGNLVSNGTFTTSTSPWISTSPGTLFVSSSSVGRFTFGTPVANRYGLIHIQIGQVISSRNYVVRFTTVGSKEGMGRVYLRNTTAYTEITPFSYFSYGVAVKNHEILLRVPVGVPKASLCIAIEQTSGTTYIDNVQLFEANATINFQKDNVALYVNDQPSAQSFAFNKRFADVFNTKYSYSITVPPYSSRLLYLEELLKPEPIAVPVPSNNKINRRSKIFINKN